MTIRAPVFSGRQGKHSGAENLVAGLERFGLAQPQAQHAVQPHESVAEFRLKEEQQHHDQEHGGDVQNPARDVRSNCRAKRAEA